MSITIKDIARAAGVYPSAVSSALNNKNHTRISAERRKYIRKVAEDMGYRPNLQAACLRKKKKPAIGVFLPDWRDPLLYELVAGLSEGSTEYDIPLSLHFGMTMDAYSHFIDSMTTHRHSGLISYVPYQSGNYPMLISKLKNYQDEGGRIITINPYNTELGNNVTAGIDECLGGELAAKYLLSQSCADYAVFGFESEICQQRAEGFCRTLEKAGKTAQSIEIVSRMDFPVSELIDHLDRLVAGRNYPVGIFSATAAFCNYLTSRCLETGIAVGKEVIPVGYDHAPRHGEYRPIPRVIQPFRELGKMVVRKMDNILAGKRESSIQLEPHLEVPGKR